VWLVLLRPIEVRTGREMEMVCSSRRSEVWHGRRAFPVRAPMLDLNSRVRTMGCEPRAAACSNRPGVSSCAGNAMSSLSKVSALLFLDGASSPQIMPGNIVCHVSIYRSNPCTIDLASASSTGYLYFCTSAVQSPMIYPPYRRNCSPPLLDAHLLCRPGTLGVGGLDFVMGVRSPSRIVSKTGSMHSNIAFCS